MTLDARFAELVIGSLVLVRGIVLEMACTLSERDLWSGIDRNAPEVIDHIETCSSCRSKAEQIRQGIGAITDSIALPSPPLPEMIGPYRILKRLGAGGMGIVYEAEQQSPKRLVAIKVVRQGQQSDEYRVRLFQREAQTLARLRHPAIAAVYNAGRTDDGQDYFAMELVQGVPLNAYVRDAHVPRRARLEVMRRICDAINYAHLRGVIHRDLKPTNILVDAEGNPKILDFGLARIHDPDAVVTTLISDVGRLMGTLPYMSPEEAKGNPDSIDVRSDVYSLGVILYELLTDQLPYKVTKVSLPEAVRIICDESPRKPGSIDRSLRGDLETICLNALAKEPNRRYQSAGILGDEIRRYLTHQPIQARPASAVYLFTKFVVRHQLFLTLALASILVVSAGRLWLDNLESERRNIITRNERLLLLRPGIIEHELATVLHERLGLYDQAEPKYRGALATFNSIDERERAAQVLVELGTLLLDRNRQRLSEGKTPSDSDYAEAADNFWEALDIFKSNPSAWRRQQLKALQGLQFLYGPEGPDLWEDQALVLDEINSELKKIERIVSGATTTIRTAR